MLTVSKAMQELQNQFCNTLEHRIAELQSQYDKLTLSNWQQADLQELHHLVHSLTGSAGTFGLQSLSTASRQLEQQLKHIADQDRAPSPQVWTNIATLLKDIESLSIKLLQMDAPKLAPIPENLSKRNRNPLVYLLEDDPEQAEHLALALREDGFEVKVFHCLESISSDKQCPDAFVLDIILPEGDAAGLAFLSEIKRAQNCNVPVVCISVRDDFDTRLAAYRAGANRYMLKPVQPQVLSDVLNVYTGRSASEPYRVVLVDDDPLLLEAQSYVLQAAGMIVEALNQPNNILTTLDRFQPDVLILDVYMPSVKGPELAAIIREREGYLSLPILFLSAESDLQQRLHALSLGGDDFITKPVLPEHLISAVTARAKRARQRAAIQDRLSNTLYEYERVHYALNEHAIVSIADRRGDIIDVNDQFCQISGYSRKELIGKNHRVVKSSKHPPEFYQNLWSTIVKGKVWKGVICNQAKDGSLYWVESTITPFLDEKGEPYQYVSIRTDITEQLRSEQAVELAKERLRRGQIYANIGTWEWNINNGELFWTEQIAPLFGYPEGDLQTSYDNFLGALHPDDRQSVSDAVAACIEQGIPYDIEHRVVWPDGTVRWLLEKGDVQRDAEGNPVKMIGVVQDINARKLTEIALAEREQQLMEAQSLASLGNWRADLQTGELFWSDQVYKIFGYQPDSFTPSVEAFKSAIHPDDTELVDNSERCAEQTGRQDVVHRIIRPDGKVRYVHELAQMQVDHTGRPISMNGTVQDITERKEAEQNLTIFGRVFDATEQGIGVTDAEGHVIYSNPAHDRLHGYEPGECLGMHFSRFLKEETLQTEIDVIIASVSEGKSWSGLLPIRRKDGQEVISYSNIGAILDSDSKPEYLFNIMVDYSDELARQEQLKNAKEEAEKANCAKSDFLSSMSHELRTPLNSIIGFSQLLALSDLSDKQKDQLSTIATSGKHLLSLINDVLEFAKLESGKLSLNIESVEVRSIIEQVIALVESHAYKNTITIEVAPWEDDIYILADPVRFKQVIVNLMSNGIKYNRPHGKLTLSWQIIEKDQQRFWQIHITDTGKGIAQQNLPRLFEPFDRLGHEGSAIEGTGIGLSITKDLLEQMDGLIEVESELEVGSTFSVAFPLDEKDYDSTLSNSLPDANPAKKSSFSPALSKTLKVLYVEDNPGNMKLMAQIGQTIEGIELRIAPSAENGLQQAKGWLPQLILLDINLPGMNGDEAYQHFRDIPGYQANSPLIYAVTANVLEHQIAHYNELGFDQIIAKPFDLPEVVKMIESARDSM